MIDITFIWWLKRYGWSYWSGWGTRPLLLEKMRETLKKGEAVTCCCCWKGGCHGRGFAAFLSTCFEREREREREREGHIFWLDRRPCLFQLLLSMAASEVELTGSAWLFFDGREWRADGLGRRNWSVFFFVFSVCMVKIGFTMKKKNEENGEGLILAVWDSSLIIGKLIISFLSIVLSTWWLNNSKSLYFYFFVLLIFLSKYFFFFLKQHQFDGKNNSIILKWVH